MEYLLYIGAGAALFALFLLAGLGATAIMYPLDPLDENDPEYL